MSSEKIINIIIADDHEIMRVGLRRLLTLDKRINILGEADNGRDAYKLAEYYNPDVALLDINMPIMDGIEATTLIKNLNSNISVIMLTAYEDNNHLEKALDAGANGYLSKNVNSKFLIDSLFLVTKGERVFSRSILNLMQKRIPNDIDEEIPPVRLTKREQEIINFLAKGYKSAEIAEKVFLSVRTVETHRANIMKKLGIKTASALVRYAVINYNAK
ncbi:MAG: response regulator transcription factor [Candidatus Kapabacteria bacterium]|nr:response regulator transcription factor [Candidatus Kapabacteria bacterium]